MLVFKIRIKAEYDKNHLGTFWNNVIFKFNILHATESKMQTHYYGSNSAWSDAVC